jgi:hypothetical protein
MSLPIAKFIDVRLVPAFFLAMGIPYSEIRGPPLNLTPQTSTHPPSPSRICSGDTTVPCGFSSQAWNISSDLPGHKRPQLLPLRGWMDRRDAAHFANSLLKTNNSFLTEPQAVANISKLVPWIDSDNICLATVHSENTRAESTFENKQAVFNLSYFL